MADNVLFVGWGSIARGREEMASEAFNEVVGIYGRMQQEGRIEGFDIVFLDPNGSDLEGWFLLHGTAEQLDAVREDPDFRTALLRATMSVDGLRVIPGLTGAAIGPQMEQFNSIIAGVPQAG